MLAFALMGLLAVALYAADVSGVWKAQVPGRQGNTMETTFNLKADGNALTGNVTTQRGETPITEGKINGDEISFVTVMNFNGNEMKMVYKGKVSGNEIKFTRSREGSDRTQEFTAKKS